MAKVQHKDLPENQLHEPKGASLAPANSFLFARGDGTTGFRPIQNSDLAGLVTASVDVQLAMNTHANYNLLDTGLNVETPAATKTWATIGFIPPGLSLAPEFSTQHITYIEDSPRSGLFLINTEGWYMFQGTFYVTRTSGSNMSSAAIRFTVDDGTASTPSIAFAATTNHHIEQVIKNDFVYLEEGQTVSYQYSVGHLHMSINSLSPFDTVESGSLQDPTRVTMHGSAPIFAPSGVKAWRFG